MAKIFLSPPYLSGSERKYVQEAFDTNWIAPLGPNVTGFEKEMGEYFGSPYPLALSSGTAAIHLSLKYLGVKEGDIVFCSSFTFSGSCNAVLYEKAIPVFIDSEPESANMSPDALRRAFRYYDEKGIRPAAVIVVDLYGRSAKWDEITAICKEYDTPILEDAAEALGSRYKGEFCGNFGELGIFSFNGNKIITTSGGGMVLCKTEEQYKKMLFWATQSKEPCLHYEHKEVGYNYRLSNICAGIGRGQLEILDKKLAMRARIADYYRKAFKDTPVSFFPDFSDCKSNNWITPVLIDPEYIKTNTEDICIEMNNRGIECRPTWKPMHCQPIFEGCNSFAHYENGKYHCEELYERGVCLPGGDALTDEQLDFIVHNLLDIIGL
ncbi:MAG: DegT/DnrJ/EryC1/StrS family aminotransferase [Clostridia bacterium]|nr:DegT/DnrJ/EryC1/StrS family aminotransferase [Clostridia bacterium]